MKSQFLTVCAFILSVTSVLAEIEFCNIKIDVKNVGNLRKDVLILVNGKQIVNIENVNTNGESNEILVPISSLLLSEGNHSIAVYSIDINFSLIGLKNVFISSDKYQICMNQTNGSIRHKRESPNGRSIGLQYSVWHGFAANAVFKMQKQGAHIKTVETLIQESLSLNDYWSHGLNDTDYYQVQPKRG